MQFTTTQISLGNKVIRKWLGG